MEESGIDPGSLTQGEFLRTAPGLAARLDRLPAGRWHLLLMWLLGSVLFCANIDMYVSGGILASSIESGWSTVDANVLFVSSMAAGYLAGALIAGSIADRYGRRRGLLLISLVFIAATYAASLAVSMVELMIVRCFMGVGLGATLSVAYGSFGEYLPPSHRGRYSAWIGLIANFSPPLGALLNITVIPSYGWQPVFFSIGLAGTAAWLAVYRWFPESPRWLASRGRFDEADTIVSRAERVYAAAGFELAQIEREDCREIVDVPSGWRFLFKGRMLKRTVTVCCALFAMNAMVYAITTWLPTMMVLEGRDASISTGMTFVMLIGAPFGIFLLGIFADKHSRRHGLALLLIAIATAAFLWSYIPGDCAIPMMLAGFAICSAVYYYALLACSIYAGEVFPTRLRIKGVGFASAFGRLALIGGSFQISSSLQVQGIPSVFGEIAAVLFVAAAIVEFCGIETKGRPLEDIESDLE